MTTNEMLDTLQRRTKIADRVKLIAELKSAYRWAARRIYNTAGGPELLMVLGEELTALASTTRDLDLSATGVLDAGCIGIKRLWVKLPSDAKFVPMNSCDSNDELFTSLDSGTAAAPTIAAGHPILYMVYNFVQLRFAGALPAGSVLRADYFKSGEPPEPTLNPTMTNGNDLPDPFHDAICSKAIAQLFNIIDDEREGTWETRARDELNDALFVGSKRTQGPTRTQPFRSGRRRLV